MIFSEYTSIFLSNEMCIDVEHFEDQLRVKFGDDSSLFETLIQMLIADEASKKLEGLRGETLRKENKVFYQRFEGFMKNNTCSDSGSALFDYAFSILNLFRSFYNGGIKGLFKERQPEHDGPRVIPTVRLCSTSDLDSLTEVTEIYRGMSVEEYNNGCLGISWSLSVNKASDFAFNVYPDKPRGCVVKASVNKADIIQFDPLDHEQEVVVMLGSVKNSQIVCT